MVLVNPTQIDAPDIIKVVLTRNGSVIPPTLSQLKVGELQTRMGAKRMIHSGAVFFPAGAFNPGAEVVLTAIPEVGKNLVSTFSQDELRRLQ